MTVRRLVLAAGVLAGVVLAPTSVAATVPAPDPLGCDDRVYDPEGRLDGDVEAARATTARQLDADVRVRVEPSLDGGLDARMAQLEASCEGWTVDGDRAPDLVVVVFSVREREASVFYGPDQGPLLESRWEAAVDAMVPELQAGRYDAAVRAALRTLTRPVSSAAADTEDDDGSGGGGPDLAPLLLVVVVVVAIALLARAAGAGAGRELDGDGDDGSGSGSGWGWSSSRRRRTSSWFSSNGSSRRSSSSRSSSRRSSSRGSRRSGGGTKKW